MTITKLKLAIMMVTALIVTFTGTLHSQENFQKIGSYEYAQFNGTWYTVINGGKGDIVDTNHLLVQLKDKADISTFDFAKLGLSKLKNVRGRFSDGYYELEIPQKTDPFETAQKLLQTNKFDEIFFNLYFEVDIASNDPLFFDQWNISKAAISQSWEINTGSSNAIVAVIDVGGDYDHEDLIGNRWSGIGYDFYNNDSDPYPSDGGRHGTAVAGIIGAVTNNGLGIAGIAGGWAGSGGIRLMHLRAGYRYWDGQQWRELISISAASQATYYAASNGARVINMSFGGSTPLPILETAINNAINNYGVVIVASAGNYQAGQSTSIGYPAKYNNVISVGATTPSDSRKELNDGTESWWGSCYGPELDIVAPGVYIRTTDLTGSIGYSTNNYYDSFNGTSSAAPHVASLVALIRSINPLLTWQQVRDIIYYTSDDKGSTGFDIEYGYGRINSLRALANAFVQTNPQYSYSEGDMSLSLIQSDYWQGFQGSPAPGIAPGMYRCDRYEAKKTFNLYVETPQGWLLSPEGFSNANPNTCYPWYNRTTTDNSVEIKTFFYYIRYGVGGNVNQWVPFDPNPNSLRKASALGKPLVAPVIASMTQSPVPIYKGTYGYVYCNLSQGNGTLTYNWFSYDQPSYVSIVPEGYRCKIIYHNTESIPPIDAPTWNFGCTVSNAPGAGWSDTETFVPSLNSDPNGCPTLAFDNRGTLISENPLLITSMSNPGKDVTDYYLINTPLIPANNKINLTIHEPQTEHTWFDNVSLLETRANPDETIVVNDEGQVINYKGVLPARILLNGETDITPNLLELDSLSVELNPGDKLTISRNAVEGDGDVVLGGEEPIIVKDRPSLIMNILTESKVEDSEEIKTESIPITNFFLRPNKSIISKRLRNLPTGTIEITVNKKLTLDYFVFVSDLRTARTRELPLVSAVHNVNGDVKTKLTGIDQNYSEMYPTERIDLSFSTTINSGNRAYILKTVGRYETDTTFVAKQNNLAKLNEQPIIPIENKLYDNYPNPFNPSTIIKYSLKDDGKVTLKIYNSLGEEVRTLVNETEAAGIYEIEFNATNLPSGVYIYQLTTPGFTQARKMILAK